VGGAAECRADPLADRGMHNAKEEILSGRKLSFAMCGIKATVDILLVHTKKKKKKAVQVKHMRKRQILAEEGPV
jgi:hypothetical protein